MTGAQHAAAGGKPGCGQEGAMPASRFQRVIARLGRTLELQDRAHARMLPMEGLRGLAVLLVFLQHYSRQALMLGHFSGFGLDVMAALRSYGNLGVELFFVLSGYLIYGTLVRRRHNWFNFMARRVQRIYPAFLVAFGIFLLLHLTVPGGEKLPQQFVAAIAYVLANLLLLPGLFPIPALMSVAWSLSYEMFFYVGVAALVNSLDLDRRRQSTRIAIIAALAVALVAASMRFDWMPYRMLPFFAGMLLAEGIGTERMKVGSLVGLGAPIAALLISRIVKAPDLAFEVMHSAAFFALCAACFSRATAGWVFCWTPLRWLGNMSYSYYLLHGLTLIPLAVVTARIVGTDIPPWVLFALMPPVFVLSLLPAFALFALIERPLSLRPAHRPTAAVNVST